MPTKRQILDALHRDALIGLADAHSLKVKDKRVREQLVDAIPAATS